MRRSPPHRSRYSLNSRTPYTYFASQQGIGAMVKAANDGEDLDRYVAAQRGQDPGDPDDNDPGSFVRERAW